jgi:hypothetical protein
MRTEAATALNNFDASIARYRIINSVKVLNQIAQVRILSLDPRPLARLFQIFAKIL